mmetsp:Transcript_136928/g.438071  ORF Transcript_136928/g.438071 Transcript_136928/m.438071 type:complete len:227 (+) Transcript_136928:605-1285(+)
MRSIQFSCLSPSFIFYLVALVLLGFQLLCFFFKPPICFLLFSIHKGFLLFQLFFERPALHNLNRCDSYARKLVDKTSKLGLHGWEGILHFLQGLIDRVEKNVGRRWKRCILKHHIEQLSFFPWIFQQFHVRLSDLVENYRVATPAHFRCCLHDKTHCGNVFRSNAPVCQTHDEEYFVPALLSQRFCNFTGGSFSHALVCEARSVHQSSFPMVFDVQLVCEAVADTE